MTALNTNETFSGRKSERLDAKNHTPRFVFVRQINFFTVVCRKGKEQAGNKETNTKYILS